MAARKPKVVITQERNEIATKSQRLSQHFRPWPSQWNWFRHCPMSADNRMSAYKPEVVITQERYEISARFQRILDIFDHAQHAGAISNIVRYRLTSDRQPEIAMAAKKPVCSPPLLFLVVGRMSVDMGQRSSVLAVIENV